MTCSDIFGTAGSAWLDGLRLPQPYAGKVTSLRCLAGELSAEITMLTGVIGDLLASDRADPRRYRPKQLMSECLCSETQPSVQSRPGLSGPTG